MPKNPYYEPVPTTLQGWRSLESRVITSQDTFESIRLHNTVYLLRGELYFSGSYASNQLLMGIGRSDAAYFEIRIRYPDGTSSGRYVLMIRNGSPSHASERNLAQILSQHTGKVVAGDIGGSFSGNFSLNYVRIPRVEANMVKGLVKQMHLGNDA